MLKATVSPARVVGTRVVSDVSFSLDDQTIRTQSFDATGGLAALQAEVIEELKLLRKSASLMATKAEIDAFSASPGVITLPDDVPADPS